MSEPLPDASSRLPPCLQLPVLARLFETRLREAIRETRLEPTALAALWLVEAEPRLRQRDYARALDVDASTFGRLVDLLERQGLLRRLQVPGDRRSRALEASTRGRMLVRRATRLVEQAEQALLAGLPAAEAARFRGQLAALLAARPGGAST